MTEAELSAALDAHDALVKACAESSLGFYEFMLAYGDFPRIYGLLDESGTEGQAVLRLFRQRIAFHVRVAGVLSGLQSAEGLADIEDDGAGRFLPDVGLRRMRELVERYPEFEAQPEIGG